MDSSYPGLEKNNKRTSGKKFLVFFVSLVLLIGSFYLGFERGKEKQLSESQSKISLVDSFVSNRLSSQETSLDFSLFWKVWDLLKEKHIDRGSFDARKLMYGAIKGMLSATGDPYSNFFDPEETKSFTEELNGSFEGIGAELGIKDKLLTIITPLPESPAEKAGLRAGDKIIKIDDRNTNDLGIDQAIDLIRGKKGTEVRLTIFREGEESAREVKVTRDVIHLKSLVSEFREDGIAYVKINTFSEDTTKEFRIFANTVLEKKSSGIVLDLRNNPGGLVDKCVEIASLLIEKGQVVVIEEDNTGQKKELRTTGGDRLSQIPLVVLINEGSASASEILAGALRDNRGVKLVGKKSFGKGSVQEYALLPGGTSAKITIAKWLTPRGEYIMEKGITPDTEIDFTQKDIDDKKDVQLEKALEIIRRELAK
ncbi:MAG: S41 family peptidase [Patescibacteria group bacterium]